MSTNDPTVTTTATAPAPKPTPIKAMTAFSPMTDPTLAILGGAVSSGLSGSAFPPPLPVDPATLAVIVAAYTAAIQAALDGGANAKAVCEKYRKIVIQDLKLLAIYVQNHCNDDLAIFTTSGFTVQTPASSKGQPAAVPEFRTLAHGLNSGQITITIKKAFNAASYFVRYAATANGVPGAWTTVALANVGKRITISGLTPGTTYAFQVQSLGSTGYSDWSDSSTIMCV